MRALLILVLFGTISEVSLAQGLSGDSRCSGNNYCKGERIIEQDTRQPQPVYQPQAPSPIDGKCNDQIPASQSYQAQVAPLTCAASSVSRDRSPEPVSDAVLDRWDVQRQEPSLRAKAQKTRYQDIKISGTADYATGYDWTWQQVVGGYAATCGDEPWDTTCAQDQYQISYTMENDYCDQYEQIQDPDPVVDDDSSSAPRKSHSGGQYDSSPVESPYKRHDIPEQPRGKGESKQDLQQKRNKNWDSSPGSSSGSGLKSKSSSSSSKKHSDNRNPNRVSRYIASTHNGKCLHWHQKQVRSDILLGQINYNCHMSRHRWCTWNVSQTGHKACNAQQAKYIVEYQHDDKWNPDYKDTSGKAYRNYMDELPNKSDLMVGEREKLNIVVNKAQSSTLQPDLQVDQKWNEYHVTPAQPVTCKLGDSPELHYYVWTIGRNKAKSPNPLVPATDADGKPMDPPLSFPKGNQGAVAAGRPDKIYLKDLGREDYVVASEQSRTYAQPDDVSKGKNAQPNQFSKFWAVTDYRIQLLRRSRGYWVSVTPVDKFNSNSGDIVGDSVTISLNGGQGVPKFFTPDLGIVPDFFGRFAGRYGVELTPGDTYYIKIQAIQKSYPFYESGCSNGSNSCQELAGEKVFSEPLIVKWEADPKVDERSVYKKWRDWREHFKVY